MSKPSDDPQASPQAVRISQSENRNQQYVSSSENATGKCIER
ncbi:hypothetical protein [Providencia heimbachae]